MSLKLNRSLNLISICYSLDFTISIKLSIINLRIFKIIAKLIILIMNREAKTIYNHTFQ